jgi:hypothetical protein
MQFYFIQKKIKMSKFYIFSSILYKTKLIDHMKPLFFPLLSLLILSGCQKESDENLQTSTTNCKLKTITYDLSPSPRTYNVIYSNDNISELSSSVDKTQYTYNTMGQLSKRETFKLGNSQVQFKSEFIYDSNGLLLEQKNYEYFSGSLQATSRYTFQYNGSKRSQMNYYGGTAYRGKTVYTWAGENINSISSYDSTNTLECKTNFTYDLTKENSFYTKFNTFYLLDLYEEDLFHIYFLCRNQLTSFSSQCPTFETKNWTYTYNVQNLTKTVKVNGGSTPLWTFTYTCD